MNGLRSFTRTRTLCPLFKFAHSNPTPQGKSRVGGREKFWMISLSRCGLPTEISAIVGGRALGDGNRPLRRRERGDEEKS